MFSRTEVVKRLACGVFCFANLMGQDKPATPAAAPTAIATQEFPVVMMQSVTAGKTPTGSKVQAKLMVATLSEGKVIPKNAVFSGEVIASSAKTATEPSRLAIRLDSVQWKEGTAAVKLYLTAWHYPTAVATGQDLQYGPPQSPGRTWNGQGEYPNPNSPSYKPFPGGDADKAEGSAPNTAATVTSNRRVVMKNVQSASGDDGVGIFSTRSDIKLDKLTTYVLAGTDLLPPKK